LNAHVQEMRGTWCVDCLLARCRCSR